MNNGIYMILVIVCCFMSGALFTQWLSYSTVTPGTLVLAVLNLLVGIAVATMIVVSKE